MRGVVIARRASKGFFRRPLLARRAMGKIPRPELAHVVRNVTYSSDKPALPAYRAIGA